MQAWSVMDYERARAYKAADPAWAQFQDCATNRRLQDGLRVTTKVETCGDASAGYVVVPQGATGIVAHARTPKVHSRGGSPYFANVDIDSSEFGPVRIRVPHAALRIVD